MKGLARWTRGIILVLVAVVIVTSLVACGKVNHPPSITSLVANPTSLAPGGSSTVTCVASDPDGDSLSYAWTCNGGATSGTGAQVTWVAPSVANTYIVNVVVSDGKGGTANGSVAIVVAVPTPTPTPVPSFGSIDIKSDPAGAEIIIDSGDTGSITPYVATHVSTGNHTVELKYEHYKWRSENVSVNGGETAYVNWALTYASVQTLTIQPNASRGKDTMVYEDSPTQNFGSTGWLDILSGTGERDRAFLQFNISSLPSTAVITQADLGLYYYFDSLGVSEDVGVYEVTGSWSDSTITWNNQPTVNATVLDTVTLPASGSDSFENWTITELVKGWFDGTVANNGVMVRTINDSVNTAARKEFYSADWSNPTLCPEIVITYYDPSAP